MSLHNNGRPADLVQYTLATLPAAADHAGSLVYVTDATNARGRTGTVAVALAEGDTGSPTGTAAWIDLTTGDAVA